MTKTKCNKIKNNKTLKITQNKKQLFAQKIIKEWKKQTNGCVKMDSTTMFKFDYYLQLRNLDDYDNHIHLFLKKNYDNILIYKINNSTILYKMKKFDTKTSKLIHSRPRRISIFSDPSKIVSELIQEYNKFFDI